MQHPCATTGRAAGGARTSIRHRKHDGEDTTLKEQEEEGCSETHGDSSCGTTC